MVSANQLVSSNLVKVHVYPCKVKQCSMSHLISGFHARSFCSCKSWISLFLYGSGVFFQCTQENYNSEKIERRKNSSRYLSILTYLFIKVKKKQSPNCPLPSPDCCDSTPETLLIQNVWHVPSCEFMNYIHETFMRMR